METLDGTEWDVVISGTGFVPSLLALALSRSEKRILHLDPNEYYGGNEAALSLSEAEAWASQRSQRDENATFDCARITKPQDDDQDEAEKRKLSPSRAYSLSLAPQLIYAKSSLIDALVSSQAYIQLDFQAVGSWFLVEGPAPSEAKLTRVPSSREDVFQDTSLDLKAKRSLMKFLRFVGNYEEQPAIWHEHKEQPFSTFLEQKFALPPASHGLITALTLSSNSNASTMTQYALPRMSRYLRSIGIFGAGFGSVMPKWGGLAEIAQVCCRACAVGGGVYVLNKSIKEVKDGDQGSPIFLSLSGGENVSTKWLCGTKDDLRSTESAKIYQTSTSVSSRSISIISSPLATLFPQLSEGGITPAGAVAVVPSPDNDSPPVHLFVHTADAGECPMTQSIFYASIALPKDPGFSLIDSAITALLEGIGEQPVPKVLWNLKYQQRSPTWTQSTVVNDDGVIVLPALPQDLALDDSVMEEVKSAWSDITDGPNEDFMRFQAREGIEDEDHI